MANVGTLTIKIEVEGADKAKKEINEVSDSGISGFGALLATFNKIRWAMLAISLLAKTIGSAFGIVGKIAKATFSFVAESIRWTLIEPLKWAGDIALGLADKIKKVGTVAGLAFAGIGVIGVKEFTELESAVGRSAAMFEDMRNGVGATKKELMNAAQETAIRWGKASEEIGEGLYFIGSAGISSTKALEMLNDVTEFSVASGQEMGEATRFAARTFRAFGGEIEGNANFQKELRLMMDKMSASVVDSLQTFPELQKALEQVGPIADALGVSFEDTAGTLMVLANAGLAGGQAGTALKRVIAGLQKDSGQAKDALKVLGLTQEDVNTQLNTFDVVLANLARAFNNVEGPIEENTTLFRLLGMRGAKAASIIGEKGAGAVAEMTEKLKGAGGEMSKISGPIMNTLGKQMERAKAGFEVIANEIGKKFAPVLRDLTDLFLDNIGVIKSLVLPLYDDWAGWLEEKLPQAFDFLLKSFERIQPGILNVFKGIQYVATQLSKAFVKIFGDTATWFENNWDTIKETAISVFDTIVSVAQTVYKGFKKINPFGTLLEWFSQNKDSILSSVREIFTVLFGGTIEGDAQRTKGILVGLFEAWKTELTAVDFPGMLSGISDALQQVSKWMSTVGEGGTTGLEKLKNLFQSIGNVVNTLWSKSVDIVERLFSTTKEEGAGMNDILGTAVDFFDSISTMIDKIEPDDVVEAFQLLSEALSIMATEGTKSFIRLLRDVFTDKEFIKGVQDLVTSFARLVSLFGKLVEFWDIGDIGDPSTMGKFVENIGVKDVVKKDLRRSGLDRTGKDPLIKWGMPEEESVTAEEIQRETGLITSINGLTEEVSVLRKEGIEGNMRVNVDTSTYGGG